VDGGFLERAAAIAPESASPPPSSLSDPIDMAGRFRIFLGGFRVKLHTGAEPPAPGSPPSHIGWVGFGASWSGWAFEFTPKFGLGSSGNRKFGFSKLTLEICLELGSDSGYHEFFELPGARRVS
jgi:hypothetical protein